MEKINLNERFKFLISYLKTNKHVKTQKELGYSLGFETESAFSQVVNGKVPFSETLYSKIKSLYPFVNENWLKNGDGEMILNGKEISDDLEIPQRKIPFEELEAKWEKKNNNLIPLYDDVSTFGGNGQADLNPVSQPTEFVNAGSWFGKTKLTAGLRHYGDSMVEYPSGCILAIKEIHDFRNIVPGQNYVIETDEIRITKRIQLSSDNTIFMAYSSNTDTYPDGTLIHQPFPIEKETIKRISLVVGRIVKEHTSNAVITI